jgi:2'-5' RNA ligase
MPASLRAFVAVETPKEVRTALAAVQSHLRQRRVRARWVRPGGMHLTLKFLGDIAADQVPGVVDALQAAAGGHPAFCLTAAGIGVFPGLRRPRVIWAGFSEGTGPLAGLQLSVEERLAAMGFPPEDRPFRAHLTIGRCSGPVDAAVMAAALNSFAGRCFGEFDAREIVLFQSDLAPDGPVYTALARAKLKEG